MRTDPGMAVKGKRGFRKKPAAERRTNHMQVYLDDPTRRALRSWMKKNSVLTMSQACYMLVRTQLNVQDELPL